MSRLTPHLTLRCARSQADVTAAQALRHEVFVEELGAIGGPLSDPERRIEADQFDSYCEHLLLLDALRGDAVVGTTRVLSEEGAARAGRFASEEEFDLSPLRRSGLRLLEVGRTCLHADYRGGVAMHRLWQGLASLVQDNGVELVFGLASFPGTQPEEIAQPLACLDREHLAPEALRPRSRRPVSLELPTGHVLDRRTAVLGMPALVKAYLRMGGQVGDGAFIDRTFGCIDVCMVLQTSRLSERARTIYAGDRA